MSLPTELGGHKTGVHCPAKYGLEVVALTPPLKPAAQMQPAATLAPVECAGQATAVQLPE